MMQVSKDELGVLIRRWLSYAKATELDRDSEKFADMERAFLLGAFSDALDIPIHELRNDMVPPVVAMCWSSGRPVSSVGNWDEDAPDQRLAGASITWAQRVKMFPMGGDEIGA